MNDIAASLSGDEIQMMGISSALISNPTFLLLDEPTAALSPRYQQQIRSNIDELRSESVSVLLVEQNARLLLSRSARGHIFSKGKVVHTGNGESILNDPKIGNCFLGLQQ
jgi:ABC-type branched-subunit amino acid transport system ATPase component